VKILALDLATSTGVAVGDSCGTPASETVSLGNPPDDRRFSNALRLTNDLIERHNPDLIVVEAPVGGPKASAYLIGLVACVRGCTYGRGILCKNAHLATVRKHFLGKSLSVKHFPHLKPMAAKKAIKQEVITRCRLLGWKPETDDEADACAIWDWACATFAPKYRAMPLGGLFPREGVR